MRCPFLPAVTLVVASAMPATSAAARQPAPDSIPVILTVSGGISRGSYQGGLNWALIEMMRRSTLDPSYRAYLRQVGKSGNVPTFNVTAIGGASAGNINGLLSAIEWCRADAGRTKPEESVFWQAWVWTGWDQLMRNAGVLRPDEHGIFDRWYFENILLEKAIRPKLGTGPNRLAFRECNVPVGVTVTRLRPAPAQGTMGALNQRYGIPFIVKVDSNGAPLRLIRPPPVVLGDPTLGEKLLVVGPGDQASGDEIGLDAIFSAVVASSAFPVAFAPRTLRYANLKECPPPPTDWSSWRCNRLESAQFVDGGVFDNNPLGLAFGLHRCIPAGGGKPDLFGALCLSDTMPKTLLYMDPDSRRVASGQLRPPSGELEPVDGLSAVPTLVKGFVTSARDAERVVFERTISAMNVRNLQVTQTDRYHAIVGDHLNAFGAFLGRPFRESDFYVGVYDGVRFAAAEWFCRSVTRGKTYVQSMGAPSGTAVACQQDFLRAAACGDLFDIDPVPRALLERLFKQEHPDAVGCMGPLQAAATTDDRLVVLEAVADANEQIRKIAERGTDDPFGCEPKEFLHEVICKNGFSILLDSLGKDTPRKAMERLEKAPACDGDWEKDVAVLDSCRVDESALSLVKDPTRGADRLFVSIQRRLDYIESGRKLEGVFDGSQFAYFTGREANRDGFDFTSSSIPTYAHPRLSLRHPLVTLRTVYTFDWVRKYPSLLPYNVTTGVISSYYVLGYRPTIYSICARQCKLAAFASLEAVWFNRPRAVADTVDNRFLSRFDGGLGFAWVHGGAKIGTINLSTFSSEVPGKGTRVTDLGAELSLQTAVNKVRIGVRVLPKSERDAKWHQKVVPIFGISDFNGIMYWVRRVVNPGRKNDSES